MLMTVLSSPTHPKDPTCLVCLFGVKLLFPLEGFCPAKIIFLISLLNRKPDLGFETEGVKGKEKYM